MTFSRFWRRRAARHLLVWALVLTFFGMLTQQAETASVRVLGLRYSAVLLAVLAGAIYVHYELLTRLLERRRYGRYALATAATVLAGAGLLMLVQHVEQIDMVHFDTKNAAGEVEQLSKFGKGVANIVFSLVMATIARYVRRGIVSHLQMQQLRALQLETELRLLKAQVNQHFLFNTLNNLYGLSLAAPDQLPEALLKLAELMRYQLDGSQQTLTTVGTEAAYLANYIGLEQLRLRSNTRVEFTAELPHPDQPLAPLLLLPLVENCFKHAIGPGGANTIRIALTQTAAGLTLRTDNSIPPAFRPAPSGLGLPTLQARLAQFYPGPRHRLAIEAGADHYAATLTLALE